VPVWRQTALDDRKHIVDYIVADNPMAGIALGDALIEKAGQLDAFPMLGRAGRVPNTRELVVHPNYILIYRIVDGMAEILRVKHAAQQWSQGVKPTMLK